MERVTGLAVVTGTAAAALAATESGRSLLNANYLPHRFCYLQQPGLVWTNAVADSLIAAAYVALCACLLYTVRGLRRVPEMGSQLWIVLSFAMFIFACATTHAMDVVTVWLPLYPLSAAFKMWCAAVSVPTAVLFARATPSLAGKTAGVARALREAESAMHSAEADYRGQIEAIGRSQMTIEFTMEGEIVKANDLYLRTLGYTEDDLKGRHHSVLLRPEERDTAAYRRFWKGLRRGEIQSGLFRRIGPTGREVCLEGSYNPILGLDGKPTKVVKWASDVTARIAMEQDLKRQERALRKSEESLERTGRLAGIAGWEVDLATGSIAWRPETYEMMGADSSYEPQLAKIIELYTPESRPRIEAAVARAIATGEGWDEEYSLYGIDGRYLTVRVVGTVELAEGKPARLVGVMQDIRAQVAAREALDAAKTRAALATDSCGIGIWEWDIGENRMECDAWICRLYGVDTARAGKSDLEFWLRRVHPEDQARLTRALEDAVGGVRAFDLEFRIVWEDGTVRSVRGTGAVLRDAGGAARRMIGTNYDVTERRQIEEAALRAREAAELANRAKSDFLANMSHEIRTPMNAILGMTHLALRAQPAPRQQAYLTKIDTAAQTLLGIMNDILDFSKIEAGKMTLERIAFSLDEVVRNLTDIVGPRAVKKELQLRLSIPPEVPRRLIGDPLRVGQILLNLVSNAVKFTERGEVALDIAVEQRSDPEVRLRFTVRDTGIGMSAEKVSRLFQSFSQGDNSITRRYGGTGLGLAISKQLCELMGGTLAARSVAGEGSAFDFTATFGVAAPAPEPEISAQALSGAIHRRRVLVVDDSELARTYLTRLLDSPGFAVRTVSSGEEALVALSGAAHSDKPFDLVVLDWRLPGIDGMESARRIKAEFPPPHAPAVLMLSAFERDEVVGGADGEVDGFLMKPVTGPALIEAIELILARREEADPALVAPWLSPFAGRHVLLVEDNEINVELATELLGDLGIAITVAGNGQEGVQRACAEAYDLILMDVQMPVMDGLQATRLIRQIMALKKMPSPPIIAMTAHAMSGDRERSIEAGMNDHVTKPIDPARLQATLLRWMPVEPVRAEKWSPRADAQEAIPDRLPPFDIQAALARVNNKPALLRKMMHGFAERYRDAGRELRDAVAAGRREEAQRLAHSLTGTAATLEAEDLRQSASAIEIAFREDRIGEVDALIGGLERSLQPAIAAAAFLETNRNSPTR